ncbi:MAG: hypothetical protein AAF485_10095, partial [Chloroflexota bacterium]
MSQRGKHTKIWIGGYHLTPKVSDIAVSSGFDELEDSGYGQDHSTMKGQGMGAIGLDGYFDKSTGSTHDALKELADGELLVTAGMGDNATPAVGAWICNLSSEQSTYNVNPELPGLIAVHGDFKNR